MWDIDADNLAYEEGDTYEKIKAVMDATEFYDLRNNISHSVEKYTDISEELPTCPSCNKSIYFYYERDGVDVCSNCLNGTLDGQKYLCQRALHGYRWR